jgi:hypothetical protein
MEHALRPYAAAGVALMGASMIAVTPVAKPPSVPDIQTSAVQLTATEADAYALLINVLDPGAFTNGITAAPTDSLGDLAVSLDQIVDLGGTPWITAADNLATDLLPLLDITSLFSGVTTSLDSLLSDLANLPDLSTILSDLGNVLTDLGNLPTATDIANDVVSALTGTDGVLTAIETELGNLPGTIENDLTGLISGDTVIEMDLSTIITDLSGLSTTETLIATDLPDILADLAKLI